MERRGWERINPNERTPKVGPEPLRCLANGFVVALTDHIIYQNNHDSVKGRMFSLCLYDATTHKRNNNYFLNFLIKMWPFRGTRYNMFTFGKC